MAEVARVALRLGFTAFGGPAAHIAMLREEVVVRRRWMTDDEFVDLLGATNLIPGPNSTEMVMHAGFRRAGWKGFLAGGLLFILPAASIVLAFAWAYVEYGKAPGVGWMLYGVKPVIVAVVLQAILGLARATVKSVPLALAGAAAVALYLAGVNELVVLFGGAALVMTARLITRPGGVRAMVLYAAPMSAIAQSGAPAIAAPHLLPLGLIFLKIGSILYGSGYVLLAFLRADFVERLGWLTDRQLLDAVAVGQFTPGPLFTTATFVGYVIGSWPGALIATAAIFLPAFAFVGMTNPLIPKLRRSAVLGAMLDGVNVASLALMAGVTWHLARSAVVDVPTAILAAAAAVVLVKWRINSAWLVLAGGLAGLLLRAL